MNTELAIVYHHFTLSPAKKAAIKTELYRTIDEGTFEECIEAIRLLTSYRDYLR